MLSSPTICKSPQPSPDTNPQFPSVAYDHPSSCPSSPASTAGGTSPFQVHRPRLIPFSVDHRHKRRHIPRPNQNHITIRTRGRGKDLKHQSRTGAPKTQDHQANLSHQADQNHQARKHAARRTATQARTSPSDRPSTATQISPRLSA